MPELVILAGLTVAVVTSHVLHGRLNRNFARAFERLPTTLYRLEALCRTIESVEQRVASVEELTRETRSMAAAIQHEFEQLNAAAARLGRGSSSEAPPRRALAEALVQKVQSLTDRLSDVEGSSQRLLLEAEKATKILAEIDDRTSHPDVEEG